MPTYDYKCISCEHVFEIFHAMEDTSSISCVECSKPSQKMIGAGLGVIYKGSGFYTTDYNRSQDYKEATKKEKGE